MRHTTYKPKPVAEVAQSAEHLVVAQVAVGSSPTFRPICPSPALPWRGFFYGAWRSLVAHLLWEQGAVSSNLTAPTKKKNDKDTRKLRVSLSFFY